MEVVGKSLDTVKVAWESVLGTRAWVVARDFDVGWGRAEEVGRLGQEYWEIVLFLPGGSWRGHLAWKLSSSDKISVLPKTFFDSESGAGACRGQLGDYAREDGSSDGGQVWMTGSWGMGRVDDVVEHATASKKLPVGARR